MAYQERFSFPVGELREGATLICERITEHEWCFLNEFGWMIRQLPQDTLVSARGKIDVMSVIFAVEPSTVVGKIENKNNVSFLRKNSTYFESLERLRRDGSKHDGWIHDDLKFWDGDMVTITSLPIDHLDDRSAN